MIYAHSFSDMQSTLNLVSETAKLAELRMNILKIKTLRINDNAIRKFLLQVKELDEVEFFWYLGSIIDKSDGSAADAASLINKACNAFAQQHIEMQNFQLQR